MMNRKQLIELNNWMADTYYPHIDNVDISKKSKSFISSYIWYDFKLLDDFSKADALRKAKELTSSK